MRYNPTVFLDKPRLQVDNIKTQMGLKVVACDEQGDNNFIDFVEQISCEATG